MNANFIEYKNKIDERIESEIRERIRWDSRISACDFQMIVRAGNVVLMGVVDGTFRRDAAVEIAKTTEGVDTVDDQIVVPTCFQRSDKELYGILKGQIDSIGLGPTERIEVLVRNSKVYLNGMVHQPRLKARAARMAWELSGVRDCVNVIEIVEPPVAQECIGEDFTRKMRFGIRGYYPTSDYLRILQAEA